MELNLIAALKRNDRRVITAEMFRLTGNEEGATMIEATNRITAALIDRAVKLGSSEPVETTEEVETPTTVDDGFDSIREAIAAGKKKKAKKLIKAAKESGAKGGVLSALKAEMKGMK